MKNTTLIHEFSAAMSSNMTPVELVAVLNELFTRFDKLVDDYGLNKVKTIGRSSMRNDNRMANIWRI